MSETNGTASTAFRAAERLKLAEPWEVYGERSSRYEIHLNGREIELVRGPILVEGYGVRVFRPRDGGTGTGFQASTDFSEEGIRATAEDAEALTQYSSFPAKKIELPNGSTASAPSPEIRDPRLWDRPLETLQEYVDGLLRSFDGVPDAQPSFGSVRATLSETTLTNSAGLRANYPHTNVIFELAVKSTAGPEGRPPGEYWVNEIMRRLESHDLPDRVADWCRLARDARRAEPTPTGDLPVVLPASVLSGILPLGIGDRVTGAARLRDLAPQIGTVWGTDAVTLRDDGRVPWGISSSPVDDEGSPQRERTILDHGRVTGLLYDARHAGAFDTGSTGNAVRGGHFSFTEWRRFESAPGSATTTLVLAPGDGGSDAELIEAAGDGIWLQQLGWAIPDPVTGAFGGEIRIGYRIRGGKLAEPVRGGTLGGVVVAPEGQPSLLGSAVGFGSTAVLSEKLLSPTLLVRPLTVAGQG
jgi:PmbA protein